MKKFIALLTVIVLSISMFDCSFAVFATEQSSDTQNVEESVTASSKTDTTEDEPESSVATIETEPAESGAGDGVVQPTEETQPSSETPSESVTNPTTKPTTPTEPTEKPPKKKAPKPQTVKNFKVASKTTKSVKLQWKKGKNAKRYLIYRAVESGKYKLLRTIPNENRTTYTDNTVASGKKYKYKIYSARFNKNNLVKSKAAKVFVFVPFTATKEFKVTSSNHIQINLKWSKINNAKRYEIYRKSATSTYKKIATTTNLYYTDKNVVAGDKYTYAVRGNRVVRNVARYSPFKYVSASAGTVSGISGVKVKSHVSRALFTWNHVSGVSGYDIYYCSPSNGDQYKTTVTKTMYLTPRLTGGKTYTYRIKGYKYYDGKKVYTNSQLAKAYINSTAYGQSVGSSYIEVCTETQAVYMYVNNKLVASTPVVTGMYGVYDTTHGFHRIISRKSPARLRGSAGGSSWDVDVSFWLGFTYDGQGLHDSTWRTSGYGGSIYKGDGSHGCVNTPYSAMKTIYNNAYIGMPVIVY